MHPEPFSMMHTFACKQHQETYVMGLNNTKYWYLVSNSICKNKIIQNGPYSVPNTDTVKPSDTLLQCRYGSNPPYVAEYPKLVVIVPGKRLTISMLDVCPEAA